MPVIPRTKLACLGFLMSPAAAGAGEPSYIEDPPGGPKRLPPVEQAATRFAVRHWTVADGLPEQKINALAQTPDRYIWCATDRALVRYDGRRFRVYPREEVPALEGFVINGLFCDGGGRLWIFDARGGLAVLENGAFRRLGVADGLPESGVRNTVTNATGECWVSGGAGDFYRYRGGRFEHVEVPGFRGLAGGQPERPWGYHRAWTDAQGVRWALVDAPLATAPDGEKIIDRHLVRIVGGRCEEVEVEGAGGALFELSHFLRLSNGAPALVSRDGIYTVSGGVWRPLCHYDLPMVKTHGGPADSYQDEVGDFWIGTGYGGLVLCQADGVTRHFRLPEERPKPNATAVIGNPSDGIWVATLDGLYQIRRKFIGSWSRREGMPEDGVSAIIEGRGGRMWMALDESVVGIDRGAGIVVRHEAPLGYRIHGVHMRRLAVGAGGEVWVGLRRFLKETQRWQDELWKIDESGSHQVVVLPSLCVGLHVDGDGHLNIGTVVGLFRLEGERLVPVDLPAPPDGAASWIVTDFLPDGEGGMFVGGYGGGLLHFGDGGWRDLTAGGEGVGYPVASLSMGSGGEVWIAGEGEGLALWREGRWHSFSGLGEVLPRTVNAAVADQVGGVWLASDSGEGLLRFGRDDLLRWLDDRGTTVTGIPFRREDGLPSLIVRSIQGAMAEDGDGKIWVATTLGAAVVDPREWQRISAYAPPAQVHVQKVVVNDELSAERVSGDASGQPIVIRPGPRRVEFDYAAVEFAYPGRVRYRYLLDGYEDSWIDAGDRTAAVYPDLPPGRYTFRVAVAGGRGGWNQGATGVELWVQPRWWEMSVTRVFAAILLAGLLWMVYLFKLRGVRRRALQQEKFSRALIRSQEDERKRLAKELHDSLGHELLVLKGALERERRNGGGGGESRLGELSGKAAEAVQQLREISHDLRPPELERFGLGPALETIVDDTARATGIHIDTDFADPGRLGPEVELGLFRIAQEALSNMAKHSDASDGRVALACDGGEVQLVIEDDGRGFDDAVLERARGTGGLGLAGMEERARLLGGTVQFVSRRTNGARVTVRIPAGGDRP